MKLDIIDRYRRSINWAIKYRRRYQSNKKIKIHAMFQRRVYKKALRFIAYQNCDHCVDIARQAMQSAQE